MKNEVLPGDVVVDRRASLVRSLRYAAAKLTEGLPPAATTPLTDRAEAIERARRDPAIPAGAFRLLTAIEAHADHNGMVRATLTELAAIVGTSPSGASERLDRLATLGFISVRRQGPGKPIRVQMLARQSAKSDGL